jgi:hypothetical protein
MIDLAIHISVLFVDRDMIEQRIASQIADPWMALARQTRAGRTHVHIRGRDPSIYICRSSCFLKQRFVLFPYYYRRPGREQYRQPALQPEISPGDANERPGVRVRKQVERCQNKLFTPDHAINARDRRT